jgi:hypothetical protein
MAAGVVELEVRRSFKALAQPGCAHVYTTTPVDSERSYRLARLGTRWAQLIGEDLKQVPASRQKRAAAAVGTVAVIAMPSSLLLRRVSTAAYPTALATASPADMFSESRTGTLPGF